MAGQKLGASALLCYIHHEPSDPGGYFSLTVANVGTCQAVLCRDGRPVPLSKVYSLENCTEEMERVKLSKAIITEVTHSFSVCWVPVVTLELLCRTFDLVLICSFMFGTSCTLIYNSNSTCVL